MEKIKSVIAIDNGFLPVIERQFCIKGKEYKVIKQDRTSFTIESEVADDHLFFMNNKHFKLIYEKVFRTKVISAFPACGKTYFYKNKQDDFEGILDSDSSDFSWVKDEDGKNTEERNPDFPNNYIQHIKENIGKVEIIFVSSHKVVRDALKENDIDYNLIYPRKDQKEDWMRRFINRGNNENFVNFISKNWDSFIDDMDEDDYPLKIELPYYNHNYIDNIMIF